MDYTRSIAGTRESNYFDALAENRPISLLIARELAALDPEGAGAKRLRTCGRYPIGANSIELRQGAHGLFAVGVKWCGSRFCPNCYPRMMGVLAGKRAARARAALSGGLGIAFLQAGQPRSADYLGRLIAAQLQDWHVAYPSPSRAPAAFKRALPGWIGADWNTEIDWDAEAGIWHVHMHALAFKLDHFTPEHLTALVARWTHPEPLAWADVAHTPEAAARYSVKAENDGPNILNLFGLARLDMGEQVAEYLQAVHGRRLRESSRKLTDVLKLGGSGEDDSTLMALAETAPGEVVGRFTLGEWCSRW